VLAQADALAESRRSRTSSRPVCAADPVFPLDQAGRSLAAVMTDITSAHNLHPARRHRFCPRVVRRARYNCYWVKRPGDTGTRYHGPPTLRLVNLSATA